MQDGFAARLLAAMGEYCTERQQCPDVTLMQSLLEAIPNPVIVKSVDGTYVGCNREMEQWLGMPRQQLLGKTPRDIVDEPLAELCMDKDREVLEHRAPLSYETRFPGTDGYPRDLIVTKAPLLLPDGRVEGVIAALVDISELKHSQLQLHRNGEFWKTVLDEMSDGVAIIEALSRNIISANKEFLKYFDVSVDQTVGRCCHDVVYPCGGVDGQGSKTMCPLGEAILTGQPTLMEHQFAGADGDKCIEVSTTPLKDEHGAVNFLVHVCRDVSARKAAEREIERLAYFDSLTGLPNRALLLDRLKQAVNLAQRDQRMLATLFIDLDHFKKINDSLGYSIGDKVLQATAKRLQQNVRESDTLARVGGDDFVLVLTSVKNVNDVLTVVRHLQESLASPIAVQEHEFYLESSIGITLYPEDGSKAQDLLRTAELAMHEAKKAGRNNYKFFSAQMNQDAFERLRLEVSLRRAMREEELFLVYQPQIDLETGRVSGVEALLRWRHPQLGIVSPARFIPLAEETGLIIPMGEWVLKKACAQLRAWHKEGFAGLRLGVNLSAVQFRQPGLVSMVETILQRTGLHGSSLELELTETVLMEKGSTVKNCLDEFKAMGLGLSIDDFGTGYSSLSYLKNFPIDRIKIAQEFVRDIPSNPKHIEIVKAIIAMAGSLKLGVIAEGVESPEQLALLESMGCHEIQGYYFSRPLPPRDCFRYLQERSAESEALAAPIQEKRLFRGNQTS